VQADVLVINIDRADFANLRPWMEIRIRMRGIRIVALTKGSGRMIEVAVGAGTNSLHRPDLSCQALLRAVQSAYKGEVDYDPELLDRARALLLLPTNGSTLRIGGLTIDLKRRLVTRWGRAISLTPLEYQLLAYLARRPGIPTPVSELLGAVWGMTEATGGTEAQVKNCILRIRKKIEPVPQHPQYLLSRRGRGYLLRDPLHS
jgi:DNA-binding winged helix-turn-helix (wHTH) protein